MLPGLGENLAQELFINGNYEEGLVAYLIENLPSNGTFIDVGANIGSISIPLAINRPDIKIMAIEASPWIYEFLKTNVDLNLLQNIVFLNKAAFKISGVDMPFYAPKDKFGKGSLASVFTGDSEIVKTVSLDDLVEEYKIDKVDFIKVDVEGFEIDVFEGSTELLKKYKPRIIFEFVDWAEKLAGYDIGSAQKFLIKHNYLLASMSDDYKTTDTNELLPLLSGSSNFLGEAIKH